MRATNDGVGANLLTVHEAGEELGLSVRHVHDLIASGTLPAVRTGRTVLVRREDLQAL